MWGRSEYTNDIAEENIGINLNKIRMFKKLVSKNVGSNVFSMNNK